MPCLSAFRSSPTTNIATQMARYSRIGTYWSRGELNGLLSYCRIRSLATWGFILPFQSSLSLSQSSPEGGIGFCLALDHLFKGGSFGNDHFEEYAGSANSVPSGQDPDSLPYYVRAHAEQPGNFRFSTNNRRFYVPIVGWLNEAYSLRAPWPSDVAH